MEGEGRMIEILIILYLFCWILVVDWVGRNLGFGNSVDMFFLLITLLGVWWVLLLLLFVAELDTRIFTRITFPKIRVPNRWKVKVE